MRRVTFALSLFAAVAVLIQTAGAAVAKSAPTKPDLLVSADDPLTDGALPPLRIDSPRAPERYELSVAGALVDLRLNDDGGVDAIDAAGSVVATIPAPEAVDARGVSVPTRFELSGTTLTEVVEHQGGAYAYGITVDRSPWFWIKCGAALVLFVAGLTPAKVLRAGAIIKSAVNFVKYLKKYKTAKAAAAQLAALLGSASGVSEVVQSCWP